MKVMKSNLVLEKDKGKTMVVLLDAAPKEFVRVAPSSERSSQSPSRGASPFTGPKLASATNTLAGPSLAVRNLISLTKMMKAMVGGRAYIGSVD